jgi:ubiquinone/menaquinone biosynthesis C-methylase UbiE
MARQRSPPQISQTSSHGKLIFPDIRKIRTKKGGILKPILDIACGGKMFYFDKNDTRVLFCDKRSENFLKRRGERIENCEVNPDCVCDFTDLPFADNSYYVVIFDPPHLLKVGLTGWQAKAYGRLPPNWKDVLRKGFAECFRVLKPNGVLIFKWSEIDITVAEILALTPHKPVFGHLSGKASKTHWICFMKEN